MQYAGYVKEAIADTPVVFVMGPRQVGKTTLVKDLIDESSAIALLLPKMSDSLAGRMEPVLLKPLSECEIQGREPTFLWS